MGSTMVKMKCLFEWNKVIREFRAEEHFVMSGQKVSILSPTFGRANGTDKHLFTRNPSIHRSRERNNLGFFEKTTEKRKGHLSLWSATRPGPGDKWVCCKTEWSEYTRLSVCHPITKVLFSGEETGKIMRGNVFFYQTLICGTTTLDIALKIIHDFVVKFLYQVFDPNLIFVIFCTPTHF